MILRFRSSSYLARTVWMGHPELVNNQTWVFAKCKDDHTSLLEVQIQAVRAETQTSIFLTSTLANSCLQGSLRNSAVEGVFKNREKKIQVKKINQKKRIRCRLWRKVERSSKDALEFVQGRKQIQRKWHVATVDQLCFQKWDLMSILSGLQKLEGTIPGPCMVCLWLHPQQPHNWVAWRLAWWVAKWKLQKETKAARDSLIQLPFHSHL